MYIKHLFLLIILILASCAQNSLKRWELTAPDYSEGMAVLEVNVEGGDKTCTLHFSDERGHKGWASLKEKDNHLIFSLQPGVWKFDYIKCDNLGKFELDLIREQSFHLVQGKFSFLGKFQVTIVDQKELTVSHPQLSFSEYKAQYTALPKEVNSRLIQGFTGKELKSYHFSDGEMEAGFDVTGRGADKFDVDEYIDFEECLNTELTVSPSFLGPSKLAAKFSKSGAMSVETKPKDLVVSDKMIKCIDDQLTAFQKERRPKDLTIEFTF